MQALYIGIMSGTSLDGVDVALVRMDTQGKPHLEAFAYQDFTDEERAQLLSLIESPQCRHDALIVADAVLGDLYAERVRHFLDTHQIDADEVAAIGVHGLTLYHQPDPLTFMGRQGFGTKQIGCPARLSAATGIPVISDFRRADMALGGHGAPLAPFLDRLLFAGEHRRVLLNLGGIANMTLLAPGRDVIAFDSGPANMVIDALMRRRPDKPAPFDQDGLAAARGTLDAQQLQRLMADPYFALPAPKSTGREYFGATYVDELIAQSPHLTWDDRVTTATHLTAATVADAVRKILPFPAQDGDQLLVSGGGSHNQTLLGLLAEQLPGVAIQTTGDYGIPVDAKEAVLFAALAWARQHGVAGNIPTVTGASKAVVLGVTTDLSGRAS